MIRKEDVFDSKYEKMKKRKMFDKPLAPICGKMHSRSCVSGDMPMGDYSGEKFLAELKNYFDKEMEKTVL